MDYVSGGLPAVQTAGKVIRAPSLKRGKNDDVPINERVKLERVLGLTVSSNAALDCDPTSELVAYPAGCTVVLFNPRKNRQSHLLNGSRKAITSLSFSADGRYIATGECGHLPSVRVWDLAAAASGDQSAAQIADFPGHKYGINCVAFSPNHKYVVSVGSQHDMIVNVWDWRGGVKVASNKVSAKVKAVSFAENGSYFVTVGNRHVKFWYLEYSRSSKYKEPVPLMGRSAILGEQRNNHFCDVACGRGEMADSTYAITKSGLLCEFNNRRLLDKWVELRTTSANCMAVGEHFIFIGCAEGIVRCFSPSTLQFVTTLPRTHYLGVDVAKGLSISHMASHPNNAKYPDVIAVTYDERNHKVTCVYNDHSLYVWDVRDIKRVGKSHSFLFHSACIWGVEMYPQLNGVSDFVGQGGGGKGGTAPLVPAMPPGSFVTCSSDDTIRFWNLDLGSSSSSPAVQNDSAYQKNIYSNELLKVVYVDPELTYLKDLDLSAAGSSEKSDTSYDGRNGVRSIRISPDGRHLASGDRAGNIRIHDLHSLDEVCRIEAHDAEVLCLEYTRPDSGYRFLASASRDRLIHVFSVDEEYNFLQTLDDHSSSITAVRFLNMHGQLQMVSCGADKSIIFRQLQSSGSPDNPWQFSRGHNVAGKTTLYDMEVDSGQKHVLTACQDRNIRVYNVGSGKHSKTFKGSVGEDGSLIKVVLDASGIYAATSSTDKTLSIYDYYSGECMATMWGHSELATGLRFTNDGRRLVSASGDGCLFVWRLPHDMAVTVHARLSQQAARAHGMRGSGPQAPHVPIIKRPLPMPNGHHLDNETFGAPPPDFLDPNANSIEEPDYRFSVGQLPLWAKKQIVEDVSPPTSLGSSSGIGGSVSGGGGSSSAGTSSSASSGRSGSGLGGSRQQVDFPKGRWAQRIDAGGITVKSVLENDSVIPFPVSQDKRDSDGSKDSSIDSGTEVRQYSSFRRETMVMSKRADGESPDFLPCPESYQELTNGEIPKQVQALSGKVTLTRGDLNELSRNRHLTDDSSIGSYRYEDLESTEHDGDVEDYSEGEGESTEPEHADQRLMYYPPAEDNPGSSDYTVNAMDVEELRRSQRRMKKPRPERLAISSAGGGQSAGGPGGLAAGSGGPGSKMSVPTISVSAATGSSVSGSQDSEEEELEEEEEEEDETAASTPSADASDRNLMSMLSMSTESLDHVGHREKFLKNTFESLSGGNEDGGEGGAERSSANSKGGSTSISSQFRGPAAAGNSGEGSNPTSVGSTTSSSSSTLRNVAVINATRQVRHDSETLKKREELLRRLEETRRKLQSVGMQSSLKTSQSISDLSHIPGDSRKHGGSGAGGGVMSGRKDNYLAAGRGSGESGGMRRACSLSDLSQPAPRRILPNPPNNVSGKVPGKNSSSAGFRTLPRQTLKQTSNSSITRSSSVGVLNQSDSETDLTTVHRSGGRVANGLSSAMRPTISSQNKVNGVGGKSGGSSGSSARRRSLTSAFSSGNLNHVGNEDSSSEEAGPSGGKSSSGQQRPRSTSIDSNSAGTSPPTSTGGTMMQQQSGMRHSNATNRSTGAARSAGDRDLGRTAREVTQRLTQPSSGGTGGRRVNRKGGDGDGPPIPAPRGPLMSPADENSMDPKNADTIGDIASAPLTLELCSSVVERLNRSADAVVHLHKRISLLEGGTTPQHQQSPVLLRTIEEGVVQAQETLRLICDPQTMSSAPLAHFPQMSEVNPKHRDFPSLPMIPTNLGAPGQGVDPGNPAVVQMMQQYSDMLLSLVQQRMGGSVPPPAQKQSQMAEGGSGQGSS
ncbi:mitogen-activated protein kinase-binding protein 1 isoform X1 [Ischnura elegans]|uniref:mitogen-activated protein kinase-binding protein 1 isoform X1 n=1 Tax=Ischnura elegans TaxID=197161 RepID=UPI001ED89800|nr:mitogen-activated protein kinase-binding protein 1 isoform X1 [Ischnura elegans]XP_046383454.1 mitogen-activated protein kinase-binding protein 1 isoform X1 [Ischnura elegans]